jgi:hypothetical protein
MRLGVAALDAAEADRVMTILDAHNPVQIDDDGVAGVSSVRPMANVSPWVATSPTSRTGATAGEQVIPLKEEQIEVGKRRVTALPVAGATWWRHLSSGT